MRVAIISGSFPPIRCGNSEGTQHLCLTLARLGLEVELVTTNTPELAVLPSRSLDFGLRPEIRRWNFRSAPKLVEIVRRLAPDVVHIEYPTVPYGWHPMINLFPLILRLLKPQYPVVTRLHEFSCAHPLRKLSVLPLVLGSHRIIVPAEIERRGVEQLLPLVKSKIIVVPVGTNIAVTDDPEFERARWRDRLGVDEKQTLLCYFGFLSKTKDIETLLRAVRLVAKSGARVKLLMIAELDKDRNLRHRVISNLIEELALSETIVWTGYTDATHLSNFLKSADVIVLPFKDGVSFRRSTFMAGIAHGLPVITTLREEHPDGLLHRENVMLVPVGDAQALVDALHDVLSSSQLRRRLSVGAKKLAERFSWENVGRAVLAVYLEVTTQ